MRYIFLELSLKSQGDKQSFTSWAHKIKSHKFFKFSEIWSL